MQKFNKIIPVAVLAMPIFAMAATIGSIISTVSDIVKTVIPLLMAIALITFVWGVIQYITAGSDAEKRTEARNVIIYGVIGLFAIIAVWGLVEVIASTFGVRTGGTINTPSI